MKIEKCHVRAVSVPLNVPVKTAAGHVTHVPLALVDLTADSGVVGKSYVFTYTPIALGPVCQLIEGLSLALIGEELSPLGIESTLAGRLRLVGQTGLTGFAVSAIDMACWDALARSVSLPLARLLGGDLRPVRTYLSVGMDGAASAEKSAQEAVDRGFKAMKIKIGYPTLKEDLDAIKAALDVLEDKARLAVDYNQSLTVNEALRRCRVLNEYDLLWIEEPTLQDDYEGHARISAAITTPVQIGENWFGAKEMAKSISASDCSGIVVLRRGGTRCKIVSQPRRQLARTDRFFQKLGIT